MIKVFEAFAGVGSQRMALENIGIEHEVVAISEIDRFAIASYEAIHGKTNNLGDISQIETADIPDHDLFTYSFPCQDISVAGQGLGLDEGSGTRSGLLWECQKVIAVKKPKYLLLENVKNLVGKRHKPNFDKWLEWLEEQGYTNYWQVLNAKDYGVPQNRERVFVVSILGEHEPYEFPEPVELKSRLKDVLEDEVEEKFYLTEAQTERLIQNSDYLQSSVNEPKINVLAHRKNYRRNTQVFDPNGITETLDTGQGGGRGHYTVGVKMNRNEVKGEEDIARTLLARDYKGFGNQDMNGVVVDYSEGIPIKNATKKGYIEAYDGDGVDLAYPDSQTRRGRVQKESSPTLQTADSVGVVELPVIAASRGRNPENPSDRTVGSPTEQRLEVNNKGVSNTLTTVQKDNYVVEGIDVHPFSKKLEFRGYKQKEISPCLLATDYKAPKTILQSNFRIRKLTPKECWRLMGFSDDDFHKAQEVNSNSQLYKQAGNSIVVPVLEGIFSKIFLQEEIKCN